MWVREKKYLTRSVSGWTGFAFSKTNLIQNGTYKYVIWSKGFETNETEGFATKNHPTGQIDPKIDQKIEVFRRINIEYDAYRSALYRITIPRSIFIEEDMKYIIFTCSQPNLRDLPTRNTTTGIYTLKQHNKVYVSKILDGYDKCEREQDSSLISMSFEEITEFSFYLGLIVPIILFMLCVYFRNHQPLKSRGILPFVALLIHYIIILSGFSRFYLTREIRTQYSCLLDDFFKIPAIMILVSLLLIDYTRVVLILMLNRNKNFIRNSSSKFFITLIRILKYLTQMFQLYLSLY